MTGNEKMVWCFLTFEYHCVFCQIFLELKLELGGRYMDHKSHITND